jgi:hypothetical protein
MAQQQQQQQRQLAAGGSPTTQQGSRGGACHVLVCLSMVFAIRCTWGVGGRCGWEGGKYQSAREQSRCVPSACACLG